MVDEVGEKMLVSKFFTVSGEIPAAFARSMRDQSMKHLAARA
jgi:hypothetical protein